MAAIQRLPRETPDQYGPAEDDLVVTIFGPDDNFPAAGGLSGGSLAPWTTTRTMGGPCQYQDAIVTFSAIGFFASFIIGNGTTDRVGLYGLNAEGIYSLIGILGVNLGGSAPQIPMNYAIGVGYTQLVCNVGVFRALGVGGVTGIVGPQPTNVTVKARPIIRRDYAG